MSQLLDAALSYAARGWSVFPCRGKRPHTQHGVLEATTDPEQITRWWQLWPNANIGLACGRASGVYVIDEDAPGAAAHLELPPTLTVYSGKGTHFYFSLPPGDERWPNTAKKALGPNVDSRGDGGYVVMPPSIHPDTGKPYAWGDVDEPIALLPDGVQALLKAPKPGREIPIERQDLPRSTVDAFTKAERYIAKIEGAIAGAGGHDATFRVACKMVNGFALHRDDARVLLYRWNQTCQPPWSEKEIEHKLDDAEKDGTCNGQPRGCLLVDRERVPPVEPGAFSNATDAAPDSAGHVEGEGEEISAYDRAVRDLHAAGFGAKTPTSAKRTLDAFTNAANLFDKEFPPTPWMIHGVMTPNSICTIGGEPKTTKTWAAIELAMAVATGTPAFGEFGVQGEPAQVALFLTEDNEQSIRNRLRAMAGSRGMDPRVACRNINITCMQSLDLLSLDHMAALVVAVRAVADVRLLVMDPLRNLHNAEENSSTEMNEVLGSLRALRTVLGCAVLFVHHMSKGDPTKSGKSGGQALRGSSSMHGAVDCGLYLTGLKTDEQNNWSNKAQIQIKGARGAGRFDLALSVEDENDEAIDATWTVSRAAMEAAAKAEAMADDETVDKLMAVLRDHRAKNLGATVPMAEVFLRSMVGVGSATLRKALKTAIERGLAVREKRGIFDLTPSDSI